MKNKYDLKEVIELMDRLSICYTAMNNQKYDDIKTSELKSIALSAMAMTNIIISGKHNPDDIEQKILNLAKRDENGFGYSNLLNELNIKI